MFLTVTSHNVNANEIFDNSCIDFYGTEIQREIRELNSLTSQLSIKALERDSILGPFFASMSMTSYIFNLINFLPFSEALVEILY